MLKKKKAVQDASWWIAASVLSLMLILPAEQPALAGGSPVARRPHLIAPNATNCSGAPVTLGVSLIPQSQSNWCWAASAQMIMNYHGHQYAQCTQANERFDEYSCCANGSTSFCNRTGHPEFWRYDFHATQTSGALSWSSLVDEIGCKGRPVAFSWYWLDENGNDDGGHMMVALGHTTSYGTNYVLMHDPLPVNSGTTRWIEYVKYNASSPIYRHGYDVYQVYPD
jgi:hypothetical protein